MRTIMVTRHTALVQYAIEQGIVPADVEVLPHITEPEQVRGCHVVGPLPLHLAAAAAQVTHIPIRFGRDGSLRGVELSLEQVREMAGPPETYTVRRQYPPLPYSTRRRPCHYGVCAEPVSPEAERELTALSLERGRGERLAIVRSDGEPGDVVIQSPRDDDETAAIVEIDERYPALIEACLAAVVPS